MADINNIFDFIDYLSSQGYEPSYANANRGFVWTTIHEALDAGLNFSDVYNAYVDVGVTIPEGVFSNIYDAVYADYSQGNIIQYLAPTSLIPDEFLAEFNGTLDTNYITYYDITSINPITGDVEVKPRYLKYDDEFTPSGLSTAISQDYATRYKAVVLNVELHRTYRA